MGAIAPKTIHSKSAAAWQLARRQHGVITREQLAELGYTREAVKHRLRTGRLHPAHRGVYAVGRPQLTKHGRWMAAVLACGPGAAGSHGTAAAILEIGNERGAVEVSVCATRCPRVAGIQVHRRSVLEANEVGVASRIPVTSPVRTLIDLASYLPARQLERAINEADKLDLVDPETLRSAADTHRGERGVAALRALLDATTFTLTDSELERRFLALAMRAGLPKPVTGARVNGFKVDFFWPELGLVVETDGLRYHRTPTQQSRDKLRDQAHAAAGMSTLRFSDAQVRHDAEHVTRTLIAVVRRLTSAG